MERKTITVRIATTGQIKVETAGFQGSSCQDATRGLERLLGTVESDEKKSEFYLAETKAPQGVTY